VPAAGRIRIAPTAVAVAVAAGAALGLSACGGSSHQRSSTPTVAISAQTSGSAASLQQDFVSVIARDSPEVVQIENPHGLGSGIVFDGRGDIVTNAHVVAGGGPYQVTDSHGRKYSARLVGAFTPDDLAVVHVSGGSLHPATFAKSSSVHVGDIVLALGNPLGLRSSVTNGIVSAVGRTVGEPNGVVLPNVIQTSAPINPGNSGGALVNLQGQVVGIPTLAATDPQLGGGAAPGIGFAIPSSVVSDIAGQIVAHGHVVNSHRAYLGVELAAVSSGGAVVVAVKRGGAAARAGIRPGDVITAIDKHAVPGPEAAAELLATLSPGARVPVSLLTPGGRRRTVSVKLGQYP
jgi:putative serine protease PepD